MKIALIISLNFRAAHISHLVGSYKQMEELGYEAYCYIHPMAIPYLPPDVKYVTNLKGLKKIDISIFWFPSLKNIKEMIKLRLIKKSKILYVFHEPIEKFSAYIASGNSRLWTIKFFLKYYVGLVFLALSNGIILPSQKAINLYSKSISKKINSNYFYLPLMYPDESSVYPVSPQRKYLSYIGGISKDHAFDEFVNFIYEVYRKDDLSNCSFLIASWRNVPASEKLIELKNSNRLTIHEGKPMTNEEINHYYASSLFVWNAYNRSTQSGVLAKSFMFGTPAIVMKKNISEFIKDKVEVVAVSDNTDYNELLRAAKILISQNKSFNINTRNNFERNYFYRNSNKAMTEIIERLK